MVDRTVLDCVLRVTVRERTALENPGFRRAVVRPFDGRTLGLLAASTRTLRAAFPAATLRTARDVRPLFARTARAGAEAEELRATARALYGLFAACRA